VSSDDKYRGPKCLGVSEMHGLVKSEEYHDIVVVVGPRSTFFSTWKRMHISMTVLRDILL
jgi:hypothetical protein